MNRVIFRSRAVHSNYTQLLLLTRHYYCLRRYGGQGGDIAPSAYIRSRSTLIAEG